MWPDMETDPEPIVQNQLPALLLPEAGQLASCSKTAILSPASVLLLSHSHVAVVLVSEPPIWAAVHWRTCDRGHELSELKWPINQ